LAQAEDYLIIINQIKGVLNSKAADKKMYNIDFEKFAPSLIKHLKSKHELRILQFQF
jgi:hypothetical protein